MPDTQDFETRWKAIISRIGDIIENSGEPQAMIDNIRKAKVRGTWQDLNKSTKSEKVIDLTDLLPPC